MVPFTEMLYTGGKEGLWREGLLDGGENSSDLSTLPLRYLTPKLT